MIERKKEGKMKEMKDGRKERNRRRENLISIQITTHDISFPRLLEGDNYKRHKNVDEEEGKNDDKTNEID